MSLIHCNLRVLMAERGLNIQKVKDKTSLSRTTISNLYNNYGAGIQFDTLKQLCELLKCQPGDLITYIDVSSEFKIMTKEPTVSREVNTHIEDDDGNSYEYVSNIEVSLDVDCKLRYEGNIHEFKFFATVKYGIDEEKNIYDFKVGASLNFEYNLDTLQLHPHVKNYVYDELDDFLIAWAQDFFNGEEIDGVTHMTIDRYQINK